MSTKSEITPLVSIICPAYNHENYIAQALDGFVMQKTNFPFEIIVHDDASTDGTARIMRDYEEKYPHLFKNIYQTENQFSKNIKSVSLILFKASKGKFIACCEGDDYWTDPYKLQKQVDFMQQYPNASMCVALTEHFLVSKNEKEKPYSYKNAPLINNIEDSNQYFHTSTYLIRKSILDFFLSNYSKLFLSDTALGFLLISKGPFIVLNEYVSVYRITGLGMWSGISEYKKDLMHYKLFHMFRKYFVPEQFKFHLNYEIKILRKLSEYSKKNNLIIDWIIFRIKYIYLIIRFQRNIVIKQLLSKIRLIQRDY